MVSFPRSSLLAFQPRHYINSTIIIGIALQYCLRSTTVYTYSYQILVLVRVELYTIVYRIYEYVEQREVKGAYITSYELRYDDDARGCDDDSRVPTKLTYILCCPKSDTMSSR